RRGIPGSVRGDQRLASFGAALALVAASLAAPGKERRHALAREFVGALVLVMAVMTFDPVPANVVLARRLFEFLPKLGGLHRLLVRRAPAVLLPALDPACDAAAEIIGVGVELDLRRSLERLERLDGGGKLHAVVGGQGLAAAKLLAVLARLKDHPPAARSWIARAGAVGMDDHLGLRHAQCFPSP